MIEATPPAALISNDAVVLGLLAAILGFVFWGASREQGFWKKFYAIVPAILPCYLLPAVANTFGLIDGAGSGLYPMARDYLLPASLVLFCVAMDIGAIVRLGPKALVMFLTGTVGVMLGAWVAFAAMGVIHPETVAGETWRGMTTIAGSWIGGGANQAAMKEVFDVPPTLFGQFAAVDVIVAYLWMAALLFMASKADAMDRWLKADNSAIEDLKQRMASYHSQHARVASTTDLMLIFAIGIGVTGLSHFLAGVMVEWIKALPAAWRLQDYSLDSRFFWIVIFATTFGVLLTGQHRWRRVGTGGGDRVSSCACASRRAAVGAGLRVGDVWRLYHRHRAAGDGQLISIGISSISDRSLTASVPCAACDTAAMSSGRRTRSRPGSCKALPVRACA